MLLSLRGLINRSLPSASPPKLRRNALSLYQLTRPVIWKKNNKTNEALRGTTHQALSWPTTTAKTFIIISFIYH